VSRAVRSCVSELTHTASQRVTGSAVSTTSASKQCMLHQCTLYALHVLVKTAHIANARRYTICSLQMLIDNSGSGSGASPELCSLIAVLL
jgi:hypothetical protein